MQAWAHGMPVCLMVLQGAAWLMAEQEGTARQDKEIEPPTRHPPTCPKLATLTHPCSISKGTDQAELLREAALLIWDEAPMAHRHAFEALDRTLRDLTGRDLPFGGKVLVAGGDFRQIPPVVRRASAPQVVAASPCRCVRGGQYPCLAHLQCPCK